MKRRMLTSLGWALLGAGGVLLGVGGLLGTLVGVGEPLHARTQAQESVLYYELTPQDKPLVLELLPGASVVRFETLLALPGDEPYDPATLYPFGLEVRATDHTGKVWLSRSIHQETRLSRAGWDGAQYTWANAMVRDDSLELADNRLMELHIPGVEQPRRLQLRPLPGPYARVLVRVYVQRELPAWERTLKLQGVGVAHAQGLAEKLGGAPWPLLSPQERDAAVARDWQRLSAEGEEHIDYRVRPVWFSGFSVPDASRAALARFYLTPWQDAAVTVRGPGVVRLMREDHLEERLPDWSQPLGVSTEARVKGVSELGGAPLEQICELPENNSMCEVRLTQAGLHTLHVGVAQAGYLGLTYQLESPGMAVGDRPLVEQRDGWVRVQPDVRTLMGWRVEAGLDPITLELLNPRGDVVGIVARQALTPEQAEAALDPQKSAMQKPHLRLSLALLDDAGRSLSTSTCEQALLPSRYEFYRALKAQSTRVSERVMCYVPYTSEAKRLAISSEAPVDVQLLERVPWVEQDELELPYELSSLEQVTFRYAPLFRRRWEPVRPEREGELWQAERVTRIAAQVRLEPEPVAPVARAGRGPGRVLVPEGMVNRQGLLVPQGRGEGEGLVALEPGRPLPVSVEGGPLRVLYRLSQLEPGAELRLTVGEHVQPSVPLLSALGQVTLGRVERGEQRLSLEAPPGQYWVVGESQEGTRWRRQTGWSLRRGEPLTVKVPMRPEGRRLAVQVYAPSDTRGGGPGDAWRSVVLAAQVQGKRRVSDPLRWVVPTPEQQVLSFRRVEKQGRVLLEDRADQSWVLLEGARVRLGDDLVGGTVGVRLSMVQGPPEVWVRLIVLDEVGVPEDDEVRLSLSSMY